MKRVNSTLIQRIYTVLESDDNELRRSTRIRMKEGHAVSPTALLFLHLYAEDTAGE